MFEPEQSIFMFISAYREGKPCGKRDEVDWDDL